MLDNNIDRKQIEPGINRHIAKVKQPRNRQVCPEHVWSARVEGQPVAGAIAREGVRPSANRLLLKDLRSARQGKQTTSHSGQPTLPKNSSKRTAGLRFGPHGFPPSR